VKAKTATKTALFALLIPLTLGEVYLCTAFLPMKWQHAIDSCLRDILPKTNDWTTTTHPLLSQEIEQVLREHIGLMVALYAATLALLIGTGLLIRLILRSLRSPRPD
jgi:hypothetical protein